MKSFPRTPKVRIIPKPLIILCAAMAFGTAWGAGRTAEDYLHGGSGKYIQGRIQEASVDVEEGLSRYPNDPKLKILADQLKKMQDQKKKDQGGSSSQSSENQNQKQDKKDSSGQGSQGKQDQNQKDKDKQKEKEKDKDKGQDQKKNQDEGKQDQQDKEKEDQKKGDSSGQAAAPAKPGQMSKEEAERLLNSYQDDEKREHEQMHRRQRKPVEVEKDW